VNLARERGRQPRLAHPTFPCDQHEPAAAAVRASPLLTQGVEVGLPAGQRRTGIERWWQLDRVDRRRLDRD
jgi:hypothetical protein